jgi:hypothetical protein
VERIVRNISFCLAFLFLMGCDGDPYSGFGAICTEGHPAVAHARSLSQEQLALLYSEMFRLREENMESRVEYGRFGDPIPENLEFLNAANIRPNDHEPKIMLAGCMDEYIFLRFSAADAENPGIVLTWAAGTRENPYAQGKQVLWTVKQ